LALAVAAVFVGQKIRLLTLTTTNKFNVYLPKQLPVLAWEKLLKNLRNETQFSKYSGLQYVRTVEYQTNGNAHFHLLINKYIPYKIFGKYWRKACVDVLKEYGISVSPDTKISNANFVGDTDSNGVISYVVKYITKGVNSLQYRKIDGVRYRPYSTSRGITLWPKRKHTPGWYAKTQMHVPPGCDLYLSSLCLIPKEDSGKVSFFLPDEWYSILLGDEFDYI
jgi:hypothetical protein